MTKAFIKRLVLSLAVICAVVLPAVPAAAAGSNPFGLVCERDDRPQVSTSVACQSQNNADPLSAQNGILKRITFIIAGLGGIVAVIVIVVGGIRYIASNGDAEQVGRAKRTILNGVIGVAVIAAGQTIIIFILNRI